MQCLSPQQQVFCNSYSKSSNGAAAAREANYSKSCARQMAAKLLKKPQIQNYLENQSTAASERAAIGIDQLVLDTQVILNRSMIEFNDRIAISAIEVIAKLLGYIGSNSRNQTEAVESQNKTHIYRLEILSREERKLLVGLLAKCREKD